MRTSTITKHYINRDDIDIGKELLPEDMEIETTFEPNTSLPIILEKNENNPSTYTYELRYACDDSDPQNPRKDWDHIDHMICFHRRYDLGDKHDIKSLDFDSWKDLEELLQEEYGRIEVILAIYLYDHSGITMSTGSFNDRWDSGKVGVIFITEKDAKENFSKVGERYLNEDQIREHAIESMKGSVKEYEDYLTGQVYGLIREQLSEEYEGLGSDSCWGFFGYKYTKELLKSNDWGNVWTIRHSRDL